MKKKTLLIPGIFLITFSVITSAQAQSQGDSVLKSKHGHPILPKAGDIALGFNAVPVIDFFLNSANYLMSGRPNSLNGSATTVNYTSNMENQITGKYYLDAKTAIRVRLGYNSLSGTVSNPVQDAIAMYNAQQSGNPDNIQTASKMTVNDVISFAKANITAQVGIEKRRGYGRLQGYYGAEFGVGSFKNNSTVTYGNAFSSLYETTYTTNFNSGSTATYNPAISGSSATRNVDTTHNSNWVVSLRGFIGVEYFFFPKISIGAEFGWSYAMTFIRGYSVTTETYYNGNNGPVDVVQTTNPGKATTTHGFSVDDNNGQLGNSSYAITPTLGSAALQGGSGTIVLLFHF
jgi:hypothetical protein